MKKTFEKLRSDTILPMKRPCLSVGRNSQGFVHLFLVLVVVLVGIAGIGYYAIKNGQIKTTPQLFPTPTTFPNTPTPTPGPTSDWKTYSSQGYNFSFKYPNWLQLATSDPANTNTLEKITFENPDPYLELSVEVTDRSEKDILVSMEQGLDEEDIEINGTPATKYSGSVGVAGSVKGTRVVIPLSDLHIVIYAGTRDQQAVVDQILSTFRFAE